MKRVLAVRTREGQYLEFDTIRARLEDGAEVCVDLTSAVFAQVIAVEPHPASLPPQENGDRRQPRPQIISGAGGIESEESIGKLGG